jgi:hypothetical protein
MGVTLSQASLKNLAVACEVSTAPALLLPLQGEKVGMRGRFNEP